MNGQPTTSRDSQGQTGNIHRHTYGQRDAHRDTENASEPILDPIVQIGNNRMEVFRGKKKDLVSTGDHHVVKMDRSTSAGKDQN